MKARVISLILLVVFGLFTYWQANDVDPGLWITIYGLVALISLLRLFNIYSRPITTVLMIAFLIYSFWYVSGLIEWLGSDDIGAVFGTMKPDKLYVEETREFLGLILGFLGLLLHVRTK